MKWKEKIKFKILQNTYKNKVFEKFPNEVSGMMRDVDQFLDQSWKAQQEKVIKTKKKRRRVK
ncbi:MAG: hypothetical protein GX238_06280 [Epulopiscium sp.]|nr:hypothetical protein [Candidatus Epulonipiscium sp.]